MYIDAFYNKKEEVINVVERNNGCRVMRQFKPDYHFFVDDVRGTYKSIYGNSVRKITPTNLEEKNKLSRSLQGKKYESDVNYVYRCFEQNYQNASLPDPHVAFFDIETAFDRVNGYSSPQDALNPIISVAVHLQWLDDIICLSLKPDTYTDEEAQRIAETVGNVIICESEAQMLDMFLTLIEDADILSGWNSDFFDIPYIINRTIKVLGKQETRRFCLWNQLPVARMIERGGNEVQSYDLFGRVHLDYLALYKKYNFEQKASYALNAVAEDELNDKKVDYDGTLDQLYHQDFDKFLRYNIQDTRLLDRLDKKLRFMFIVNGMCHSACVPFNTALSTVAPTDNFLLMDAHRRKMVAPDKKHGQDAQAAGGWVATPKRGLHKFVGSTDLNSLYPSVLRALNMSPETIVGQIDISETNQAIADYIKQAKRNKFTMWWNDRFEVLEMQYVYNKDTFKRLTVKFEDGKSYELTGAEIYQLVYESGQPWTISANGTIFRYDIEGLIPEFLTNKYAERKSKQKIAKKYESLNASIETTLTDYENVLEANKTNMFEFDFAYFENLLESKDINQIHKFFLENGLYIKDGFIRVNNASKKKFKDAELYWDLKQVLDKLILNGLYGSILNPGCRFFDQRIGQSTTLTGRNITRHMSAKTNEIITGEYDHRGKSVIYGDSVTEDSIIKTNTGDVTVKEIYEQLCNDYFNINDREYGKSDIQVLSYDQISKNTFLGNIEYVYRHRVTKPIWEIEDEDGNIVKVTEDHSIMIERDGKLLEVKPSELHEDDLLVTINGL